jgi:hypothetical protein
MNPRFLVYLFINTATKHSAEAQLERVLEHLPKEYAPYVYDINVDPGDKLAALEKVTVTPTVVIAEIEGAGRRALEGTRDDDQLRRFLLGLGQSE